MLKGYYSHYICLFIVGFLSFPGEVFAQYQYDNLAYMRVFSWDEAVHQTKINNPDIAGGYSLMKSAEYRTGTAFSAVLPQVSFGTGFSRGYNERDTLSSGILGSSTNGTKDTYSAEISVSQNIFAGGSNVQKIRSAMFSADAANYDLKITKANVSYQLKSAFEGLRYAKDYLALSRDILKRREENLALISLRFKNGLENKGSVLLAEAYLSEAKLDVLKGMNSLSVFKKKMASVLGVDEFEQIDIVGEVPVSSPIDAIDMQSLAVHTPVYLKAVANEDSARATMYASAGSFLPSVNFSAGVGKQDSVYPMQRDNWSVGITARLPLFTGGGNYYSYRSARENYKASSYNRISVSRSILADIADRHSAYVESIDRLNVDESYVKASQVRAEIARQKYNNGLTTFDEWDRIENDLISQQKRYVSSKQSRVVSEAAFEQVLGIGVIE